MRSSAVGAFGCSVRTRTTFSHPAPSGRAPVVCLFMTLRADGASGCCGLVVWSDVTPTTTPAAEGIRSHLLYASTSYRAPKSLTPYRQRRLKIASPRTVATTEGVPSSFSWNRAWAFAPPSHLASAVWISGSSSKSADCCRLPVNRFYLCVARHMGGAAGPLLAGGLAEGWRAWVSSRGGPRGQCSR